MKKLLVFTLFIFAACAKFTYAGEIEGKVAEKVIAEGEVLHVTFFGGNHFLLIMHKKRIYQCQLSTKEGKLHSRCNNSD